MRKCQHYLLMHGKEENYGKPRVEAKNSFSIFRLVSGSGRDGDICPGFLCPGFIVNLSCGRGEGSLDRSKSKAGSDSHFPLVCGTAILRDAEHFGEQRR
jgi:hypothetical protein